MNVTEKTFLILGIIIVGGALGGFVGALISENENLSVKSTLKRVVIGIGCAFLVPLFLNMISSTLLKDANAGMDCCPYFVFAGFCVIAAISSKNFISNVEERLIRQVKDVKEEVQEVRDQVEPIVAKQTEPSSSNIRQSPLPSSLPIVSSPERAILEALNRSKYSFRTIDGVAKDVVLDVHVVEGHIGQLQHKGLVRRTSGETRKNLWCLTELGKAIIESPSQGA
jgi:hypothetical protein